MISPLLLLLLVDGVGLRDRRGRHRSRVPPAAVAAGRLWRRSESRNRTGTRSIEVDDRPRSLVGGERRGRRRHHVGGGLAEAEVLLQLEDELLVEHFALTSLKILLLLVVERLRYFLRLQNGRSRLVDLLRPDVRCCRPRWKVASHR